VDKEIRILIVEDSEDDAELTRMELDNGNFAHTSKWVTSRDEFLKGLEEYAPDIILCDYKMPTLGAPDALEIVKKRFPQIPFIVVSGTIGEDTAVEMLRSGAVDYIMKDRLVRLVPAIKRALDEARWRTERIQSETYQALDWEVLQVLNRPEDLHHSIPRVFDLLKTRIGLDAVGMRLQEGEDFPYFIQEGFPKDFLLTENTLVERGAGGGVCRDSSGHVRLECTCGLVISGKTDLSHPFFTRGGSFWTNDSFSILDLPPDQDPRLHPRNQCIHQGYASVALVPIRTRDQIVGLLQFNDRKKGRFSLASVERLENIAAHIGEMLIRKQAEDKFLESHALLSSLTERAPGILYQFRMFPDGRTSMPFASTSLFTKLGLTPEELQKDASKLYKAIHPEDFERFLTSIQESVRTLTEWKHEFRFILPNGEIAWYRANSSPEKLPDQSILWHGFFWDITERRRTEEALLDEKMKAQRYFESAAVIMMVLDKEGRISLINKKGCEILGYQKEELEGINWFDHFIPEKIREEIKAIFHKLVKEEGIPFYHENVVMSKNGEERLIAWRNTLLKDSHGDVVTILSSGEDITERKKSVEMLKESEKKFRLLFENSHDAIMTLEPPLWKYTSGNQAAVDMFMVKREADFLSREPWILSPERQPDGRSSLEKGKEILEKVLCEGPDFFEWTHQRSNGEEFPAMVSLAKAEVGGKIVVQATVRDVTAIKKLEKEMKKRLIELEIFYKASMGREERILELKKRVAELEERLKP